MMYSDRDEQHTHEMGDAFWARFRNAQEWTAEARKVGSTPHPHPMTSLESDLAYYLQIVRNEIRASINEKWGTDG
jgi:hypothetical protein